MIGLTYRLATEADLPAIAALIDRAIETLQDPTVSSAGIAARRANVALDTQSIADRTYFLVEHEGALVGGGGWSFRAGPHGDGDRGEQRVLDPERGAARIQAMYTDPDFVRRGVGRLVLALCEDAARAAGFGRVELMATLAGEPLYRVSGYAEIERTTDDAPVALVRMGKRLD